MLTFWEILNMIGISYTFAKVGLVALVIGFVAGMLSVFFVSQERSIISDAMAHSTLPGVALVFLMIQQKDQLLFMLGAATMAFLSLGTMLLISRKTKLKEDAAIGVTLSLYFSLGIALLTYIQSLPIGSQAGLEHYIFGNIAFVLMEDLIIITILASVIAFTILLFWKEFKLILFDRTFAINLGIPVQRLEFVIMILITLTVVIGMDTIGVIMIAGLLIGPAIAARQWSHSYRKVVLLSGLFGGVSGVLGALFSSKVSNLPPGPTIIVVLSGFILISLLFGTKGGYLYDWAHKNVYHRQVDHHALLDEFIKQVIPSLEDQAFAQLEFDMNDFPDLNPEIIRQMNNCGFCKILSDSNCTLTYKGVKATQTRMEEAR